MPALPALVTLHVWRVPAGGIPQALVRVATDRVILHRAHGLTFTKSLGTGGAGFRVRDATPERWALLCAWRSAADARRFTASAVVRRWARAASEGARLDLVPLSSRGRWSRREPFGSGANAGGPVVALTRARLRAAKAAAFYRAVPPVSATLAAAPGLRVAFGVGEAPVGVQGTVSVWDDAAALRQFAYDRPEHAAVVRRTPETGWYAEELFARFALVGAVGSIDGTAL